MNITIEICCGSVADVLTALEAGADRVELNSAPEVGGLTPSPATVAGAVRSGLPLFCMLRPRIGSFCYTAAEFETMLADAECLLQNGAAGVVSGFLKEDGSVDEKRCQAILALCGREHFVFHRAFDLVPDWREALDLLIEMGVKRVLSSGQAGSAAEGAGRLRQMIRYARGRIEILPAGGIRPENVLSLLDKTSADQIHSSCGTYAQDLSGSGNQAVCFDVPGQQPAGSYKIVDPGKAARLVRTVRNYPCDKVSPHSS